MGNVMKYHCYTGYKTNKYEIDKLINFINNEKLSKFYNNRNIENNIFFSVLYDITKENAESWYNKQRNKIGNITSLYYDDKRILCNLKIDNQFFKMLIYRNKKYSRMHLKNQTNIDYKFGTNINFNINFQPFKEIIHQNVPYCQTSKYKNEKKRQQKKKNYRKKLILIILKKILILILLKL